MTTPIKYVAQTVADQLHDSVPEHLDRYLSDGFDDLVTAASWGLLLNTTYDPEPLKKLDPAEGPDAEVRNSLLVYSAFEHLSPASARENRIWTRLSHVDCIEFSRLRWLRGNEKLPEEKLVAHVRTHFFAGTRTACRDDHAISRLWWNAWIALQADPMDPEGALRLILARADTRQALVERPWLFTRPTLASGVVRAMRKHEWTRESEANLRDFLFML